MIKEVVERFPHGCERQTILKERPSEKNTQEDMSDKKCEGHLSYGVCTEGGFVQKNIGGVIMGRVKTASKSMSNLMRVG